MTNELQIFNFNNHQIRTVLLNGEPWFVARDVCKGLEIKNTTQAIHKLDEDERSMLNIGRQGKANIINEPGVYGLVWTSNKEEAKEFKRWLKHEVLPSIRKTGSYSVDKPVLVSEHTRALPAGKKEIVLSPKARKEIGGIVKSCAAVAVREEIDHSVNNALERLFNPNPIENRNLFRFCSILQSVLNDSLDDILCTADKKDLENRRLKRALQKANSKLKQINASAQPIVIE